MKHYMHSYISNNRFLKIIIIHRRIINIQQLIAIKKKYNIFGNVYVGNYKNINFRLFHFLIPYNNLITYDDGVGSLLSAKYLALDDRNIRLKGKVYSLFKIDIYRIMMKHKYHYSIYKNNPSQLFRNVRLLKMNTPKISFEYSGHLLLTTNNSEVGVMTIDYERILFDRIITNLRIEIILHHPAKLYNLQHENCSIINDPFIAEDIIANSAISHVYSLSASSIIGVIENTSFERKNITYLVSSFHLDSPARRLLENVYGVRCIEIDSLLEHK